MLRMASFSVLIIAWLAAGCTPGSGSSRADGSRPASESRPQKVVVVMDRSEPPALTGIAVGGTSGSSATRFFSAGLSYTDLQGLEHPYVAEALPRLDTDTWRILPDGRMETTHRLRPNLTWHDGTPLDAADFVFGHHVVMSPGQSLFAPTIADRTLEQVVAVDPGTVLIRWPAPYTDPEGGVRALPRHLLQPAFEGSPADVFASLPYWTTEYVGLGPYRLTEWALGAYVEGAAFDGHALGRPKIDRVRLTWSGDANTVTANVLAGTVDVVSEYGIRFEQGVELDRRWDRGTVMFFPDSIRYLQAQFRPEYVNPQALLDVRVRKALMHSLDRQTLVDGLLDGKSTSADTLLSPDLGFYPEVDRVVPKYPYDLRRADALMNESGFVKGGDGFYASPSVQRFRLPILGDDAKELTILTDSWGRGGVEVVRDDIPPSRISDVELRSTFPALAVQFNNVSEATTLNKYVTSSIAMPPRWAGFNRGAYANPEFDRLSDAYYRTLERNTRNGILTQAIKLLLDDVIAFPLYYRQQAQGYSVALQLPFQRYSYGASLQVWEWQWR